MHLAKVTKFSNIFLSYHCKTCIFPSELSSAKGYTSSFYTY